MLDYISQRLSAAFANFHWYPLCLLHVFFRRDSTSKRVSFFKYVNIAQLVSIGSIALYLSWCEHSLVAIGNRHNFSSLYEVIFRLHALLDLWRASRSRNYDVIRASKSNSIEPVFEKLSAVQIYGLNSFELGDASYSRINGSQKNVISIFQRRFNYIRVARSSSCLIFLRILVKWKTYLHHFKGKLIL